MTTTKTRISPSLLIPPILPILVVVLASFASPAGAQVDTGSADLTRYVALGDSLTAGFSSGSLHIDGQRSSYPKLIAEQSRRSVIPFEQPLVTDPGLPAVSVLASLDPLTIAPRAGLGSPINLTLPRPYDNLAVPGARVGDVLRTVTDNGGLHDLILRGIGTQLEQGIALEPAFVTVWIGSNDALRAVGTGMVIEGVTLTPLESFENDYRQLLGALVESGVGGGAVATLPSVTSIPFVTTLPPVVIHPATGEPVLVNGAPVPLLGPDGPLSAGDFVLLTASTLLARGDGVPAALGGSGRALPDQVVLSASEAAAVTERLDGFNTVIRSAAADAGWAVADMHALFEDVRRNGLLLGGVEFSTDFLTGGLFSLDGVHASPLGYALAANEFLEAINDQYGGSIPGVDLASFAFGERGILPGARPVEAEELAGAASQVRFSRASFDALRLGLGIPRIKKLIRLKRKLERKQRRLQRLKQQPVKAPALRVRERHETRLVRVGSGTLGPVAGLR